MSASTNARSIAIGTLLAALSAGCLVAFTLVAGSADYPTTGKVVAAQPRSVAAPVTLAGSDDTQAPQITPDDASNPDVPIVLGTRVSNPETDNDGRDQNPRQSKKDGKDTPGKKGDKGSGDKEADGGDSPPRVAKPVAQPPDSSDSFHAPRGHAYGHDKKAAPHASSNGNTHVSSGPPAHAQANGHDDSSSPSHASSNGTSQGPPAHASSNGHGSAGDPPGPPPHAAANGHAKVKKEKP